MLKFGQCVAIGSKTFLITALGPRCLPLVGMSPKTYQKTRKYLENLGWIECRYRGFSNSVASFVNGSDPIKKVPAGIFIISGHSSQSLKAA